jgi:hypothetical protein
MKDRYEIYKSMSYLAVLFVSEGHNYSQAKALSMKINSTEDQSARESIDIVITAFNGLEMRSLSYHYCRSKPHE